MGRKVDKYCSVDITPSRAVVKRKLNPKTNQSRALKINPRLRVQSVCIAAAQIVNKCKCFNLKWPF